MNTYSSTQTGGDHIDAVSRRAKEGAMQKIRRRDTKTREMDASCDGEIVKDVNDSKLIELWQNRVENSQPGQSLSRADPDGRY